MVSYDLEHQIRCAKHTFSGRCDITPMVCCSFGVQSTVWSGGKSVPLILDILRLGLNFLTCGYVVGCSSSVPYPEEMIFGHIIVLT